MELIGLVSMPPFDLGSSMCPLSLLVSACTQPSQYYNLPAPIPLRVQLDGYLSVIDTLLEQFNILDVLGIMGAGRKNSNYTLKL